MKKIRMARGVTLTFEEGCNKYLENCRQRNLRDSGCCCCYRRGEQIICEQIICNELPLRA